jgi:phenylpyruvate tautomerase
MLIYYLRACKLHPTQNFLSLISRPAVPGDRVKSSEIIAELSKTIALCTKKPESYVLIRLGTDQQMSFAGTEEPCCLGELISIGGYGGRNAEISAMVMAIVEKHLGISSARFYLKFTAPEGHEIGWKGATF